MKKFIYWSIGIISVFAIIGNFTQDSIKNDTVYSDQFFKVRKLLKEKKPRKIRLKQLAELTVQNDQTSSEKINLQGGWTQQNVGKPSQGKLIERKLANHQNSEIVSFDFNSLKKRWQVNWYLMDDFKALAQKEFTSLYTPIMDKYASALETVKYQRKLWQEVYSIFASYNHLRLTNIMWAFRYFMSVNTLNKTKVVQLILNFIQSIEYFKPQNNFGLYLPHKMLSLNRGDCDSKSLLMIIILKKLGIDAVIMHSLYYKHAMVGVNISSIGKYKINNAKKYYFAETTVKGFALGQLSAKVGDLKKWFILPISLNHI